MDDRILVVDDNQDVADALVRLIKALGCEATACYSGKEAADLAAVVLPDMAIIDLAMPEMDGYETMQLIRQRCIGTHPILVALTGFGEVHRQQRAFENGFDFHVVKPMCLETLKELLLLLDPAASDLDSGSIQTT